MFTNLHRWVMGFIPGVLVSGCALSGLLDSGASDSPVNQILRAKLQGVGAQGFVEFDEEGDHHELTVEVTGGQPGATIEVRINGEVVLSVTLNEAGDAHFEFDSEPDEPGETVLPMSFSGANEGDTVDAGEMSGMFHEEADDDDDDADEDDGDADDDDEDDGDDAETEDVDEGDVDDGEADDDVDNHDGDLDGDDDGEAENT